MTNHRLIVAAPAPGSPFRVAPPERGILRVAAVQDAWHPDPARHEASLADGIALAAGEGARLVCLQELTLSPYFAVTEARIDEARAFAEEIPGGRSVDFAAEQARRHGVFVEVSLYEGDPSGGIGWNTAVCVGPDGGVISVTRKTHIPAFPGYRENCYFAPGDSGTPLAEVEGARFGFPTCWDQWFPELSRAYGLAGADVIVYPTAIGLEPDAPEFDTQPIWEQVIVANGITAATFMMAINRIGTEEGIRFYGSSFISDPYGRVLARAPRDEPAVLVADLDLDQRRDWLRFGLLGETRRPETYGALTAPRG